MPIKRNTHWKTSQLLLAALSLGIVYGCGPDLMQEDADAATSNNSTIVKEFANPIVNEVAVQERNHPTGVIPSPNEKDNSSDKYVEPGKSTSPKLQSPPQQNPVQQQQPSTEKPSREDRGIKSEIPAPACPGPANSMRHFDNFMTYTDPAMAYFSNKFSHILETY